MWRRFESPPAFAGTIALLAFAAAAPTQGQFPRSSPHAERKCTSPPADAIASASLFTPLGTVRVTPDANSKSGAASDPGNTALAIATCSGVELAPADAQMRADGGTGTVRVTAGDGCAWTGVSNDSWITITDGANGAGAWNVLFTAAANSGAEARTGTLTIGGSAFSLRQAGQRSADLELIRTVQVTPGGNFTGGGFARVYDSPTAGRIIVTFNAGLGQPQGECSDSAHVYREYTADLQDTGTSGAISCKGGGDIGSLLVGNAYYLVKPDKPGDKEGWAITKYDAVSWEKQAELFHVLDEPREASNDPMVTYVNGQLDASSEYDASGTPSDPSPGTFHLLFSPDLQFLGEKVLADTPHVHGSSMLVVDGVTYLVSANAYLGDLVAMKYDASWGYLGARTLVTNGLFSEGLAFDGRRFYVAYLDTTLRTDNHLPVSLNVRLAAFDREWNLLEDVPVTSFGWSDLRQPGRPYLLLHGDRLYVSYDCDTIDPITHQEQLKGQAYLAVFEVASLKPHTVRRHVMTTAEACPGQLSPLGVLRSTDHGATWTPLGNACMQGSPVYAVDPTGLVVDGKIVLYVVDLSNLSNAVPQTIYRTTSMDGVNFTAPEPAYTQTATMVDPGAVRLPDGSFRLYIPSESEGTISATSSDGLSFTRDSGVRATYGGMPGALVLPDHRVRMFLNGDKDGNSGIFSMLSSDGLTFTEEGGLRVPSPAAGIIANDAQPIRLADGTYLMLYQLHDATLTDQPKPWTFTELHLATSADSINWTPDSRIIGWGGTSCVVEMPDGTMYIYYVNK